MNDEEIIKLRKEKIFSFFKKNYNWVSYFILAIIVFIGLFVRTRNISKLKDISTGSWTLGPDLDPFLFLRWAEHIIEYGKLMALDTMRYVPLGFNTAEELRLLPYLMAWFHKVISVIGLSNDLTYSAIIFPVFMFGLAIIAFFLFARKIFYKEKPIVQNSIALVSSLFFALTPSLLPRTIAGIPEKESAAFFFIFLSFYLFLEALTSEKIKGAYLFSLFAGISTGLLALIWGGFSYVFLTIPVVIFFSFVIEKIKKKEYISYLIWLITSFAIMIPFSVRYSPSNLINSTSTSISILVALIIGLSLFVEKNDKLNKIKEKIRLSPRINSILISLIALFILVAIFLGPEQIIHLIKDVFNSLVNPQTSRFGLTVAENKQPFFINDWKESFGPILFNIPIYFWMFMFGSVVLFYVLIKELNMKEKTTLVSSYFLFLIGLIFSKYSQTSIMNGESSLSILVYFAGALIFLFSICYVYYGRYKRKELDVFSKFEISYILYFMVLVLTILAGRAAIRLVMVLASVTPIVVGFLVVKAIERGIEFKKIKNGIYWVLFALFILILSILTINSYYQTNVYVGSNYAPGMYQYQWQNAMSWVRDNTPTNAVFGHWWDYGYWVQSIGKRATILDGGNAIGYWNHLMGRHVLTGSDTKLALDYLYAHNGTHLLIDSTDIGKYTAFSSIGSDENYDRMSWINTFLMDTSQTQITNSSRRMIYTGGWALDDDIIYINNGSQIYLPGRNAGLGAIFVSIEGDKFQQPVGVFVYNGRQYNLPIRYLIYNENKIDFGSGIDAGIFIYPSLSQVGNQISANEYGALMFLSQRTVNSHLARIYLFNENLNEFNLVHTEDSFVVSSLKSQGINLGNFLYYQGFQGPIKIWEINYPSGIKLNESYLDKSFPNPELNIAKPGVY